MKSEIKKMTASEYLKERGWVASGKQWMEANRVEIVTWTDSTLADPNGDAGWFGTEEALTIQRARDAAEEREAWDQFASAILSTATDGSVAGLGLSGSTETCAQFADALLDQRRARFAVEIVKESEDKPEEASRV